jgi:hypothetical protein
MSTGNVVRVLSQCRVFLVFERVFRPPATFLCPWLHPMPMTRAVRRATASKNNNTHLENSRERPVTKGEQGDTRSNGTKSSKSENGGEHIEIHNKVGE